MFRIQFSLLSSNDGPARFLTLDSPLHSSLYRQYVHTVFVIYDLQYDTELRSYINKTILVYFTLVLCSFVSHFHLCREHKGAIYSGE